MTLSSSPATLRALWLLQQRRKELFERLPMGVLGVRVTELGWLRDGALHRIRADDCLEHVERLKLPLQEGRLVAATLELRFLEAAA